MPGASGTGRSLSRKGCPYGNAVVESTNHIPETEFVYRHRFSTPGNLRAGLSDLAHGHDNFRKHSTPGNMAPAESEERDLRILSK
jgi:transposase InsO family protein